MFAFATAVGGRAGLWGERSSIFDTKKARNANSTSVTHSAKIARSKRVPPLQDAVFRWALSKFHAPAETIIRRPPWSAAARVDIAGFTRSQQRPKQGRAMSCSFGTQKMRIID